MPVFVAAICAKNNYVFQAVLMKTVTGLECIVLNCYALVVKRGVTL